METGVAGEGQLHRGVGEASSDLAAVSVFDGDAQVRRGLLVGRRVLTVEAEQPNVDLVELVLAAEDVEELGFGPRRLALDVEPGEDEGHGVAVAADVGDRDLELAGRLAAAGYADPDAVGTVLGQRDGVRVRNDIRVGVVRTLDLVQQLSGHGAYVYDSDDAVVLGNDAAAVGLDLRDREARVAVVDDLVGEGVVAAACLRTALDDVTGRDAPARAS